LRAVRLVQHGSEIVEGVGWDGIGFGDSGGKVYSCFCSSLGRWLEVEDFFIVDFLVVDFLVVDYC